MVGHIIELCANVFHNLGSLLGIPTPYDVERKTVDENGNIEVSVDKRIDHVIWLHKNNTQINIPVSGVSSIAYATYGGGGNGNLAEPHWQTVGSLPAPEQKPVEKKPPTPIKPGERYLEIA